MQKTAHCAGQELACVRREEERATPGDVTFCETTRRIGRDFEQDFRFVKGVAHEFILRGQSV